MDCEGNTTAASPGLVAKGCGTGGRSEVYLSKGDDACSDSTLPDKNEERNKNEARSTPNKRNMKHNRNKKRNGKKKAGQEQYYC